MKTISYYIASGLDNVEKVRLLKSQLDAIGWKHTYDWTAHGSVQGESHERFAEVAEEESHGVVVADVVIVLLPGGRGTHVELGMALGMADGYIVPPNESAQPKIFIYSETPEIDFGTDRRTCAFYHHPLVARFSDWNDLIVALMELQCPA